MNEIQQNPVEAWIRGKIGGKDILAYQLEKIQETLAYVSSRSPFYQKLYQDVDLAQIKTWEAFKTLPFISAADLTSCGPQMLCVSQNEIQRIVTLLTSGTEGEPKRLYFTRQDQELTVDFFHQGMKCLVDESDHVMILLPYRAPGSVGDLLALGLERLGCRVYPYGLIEDVEDAAEFMVCNHITSLVGNPVQVLRLAEIAKYTGIELKLKSVLLSTDYVPDALARRLSALWHCQVYEHYGMTEMCFGGGVFCHTLQGYHMREADLYFEIIDPGGVPVSDGEYGEVVFTTLTRTGMPLIRYRTGDWGRFRKEGCSCGSLPLMEKIKRRMTGGIPAPTGKVFYMGDFDEVIFADDHVTDYQMETCGQQIQLQVSYTTGNPEEIAHSLQQTLLAETGFDCRIMLQKEQNLPQQALSKRQFV